MPFEGRLRRKLQGVALLLIVLSLIASAVLGYNKAFTPIVPVTVTAERAGLLMDPGSAVSLRGITVGEVRVVSQDPADGQHAVLQVALQPSQIDRIPAT